MKSGSILASIIIATTMSGCGGEPRPWLLETVAAVRSLTDGGLPPALSSGEIARRLNRLKHRSDTLLLSNFGGSDVNCRATVCITQIGRVVLSDFEFSEAEYQAVLTRSGIPLAQLRQKEQESSFGVTDEIQIPDTAGYGGWLEHSAFVTLAGPFHTSLREDGLSVARLATFYSGEEEGEYTRRVGGFSFGNHTGSMPIGGSATWTGVLSGIDMVFNHPVQGDAELVVNFERSDIDVAFTEISDLETLTKLTRPDLPLTSPSENLTVRWSRLPLTNEGSFGALDGSIEGWFYGPDHQEAGGIFQRYGIVGAFGARRVER